MKEFDEERWFTNAVSSSKSLLSFKSLLVTPDLRRSPVRKFTAKSSDSDAVRRADSANFMTRSCCTGCCRFCGFRNQSLNVEKVKAFSSLGSASAKARMQPSIGRVYNVKELTLNG